MGLVKNTLTIFLNISNIESKSLGEESVKTVPFIIECVLWGTIPKIKENTVNKSAFLFVLTQYKFPRVS